MIVDDPIGGGYGGFGFAGFGGPDLNAVAEVGPGYGM